VEEARPKRSRREAREAAVDPEGDSGGTGREDDEKRVEVQAALPPTTLTIQRKLTRG
jgi:hypothetical protein